MGKAVMSSIWQSCSQEKACIHSPGFSQGFRILIFPTEIKTSHISLSQSYSDKFILLWFCLALSSSSSSLGKPVSPPPPLNFLAAEKQPRQNQQLDWEGRSGGLELASLVMHRNHLNAFHDLTGLPGGRGNTDFSKT